MLLFTTRYLRNQMITYARLDYSRSKITWERPHLHVAGLVDQIGGLDDLLMLYVGSRCTHGQVIQLRSKLLRCSYRSVILRDVVQRWCIKHLSLVYSSIGLVLFFELRLQLLDFSLLLFNFPLNLVGILDLVIILLWSYIGRHLLLSFFYLVIQVECVNNLKTRMKWQFMINN